MRKVLDISELANNTIQRLSYGVDSQAEAFILRHLYRWL